MSRASRPAVADLAARLEAASAAPATRPGKLGAEHDVRDGPSVLIDLHGDDRLPGRYVDWIAVIEQKISMLE